MKKTFRTVTVLLATSCLPVMALAQDCSASNDTLLEGFCDPPTSARPRVWWHWMNGNITKEGIRKDLEWMKRAGIGGVQTFDANLSTPQIVTKRLTYMHPDWQDAFRYAANLANKEGLELAIAGSPGWSETGGPWVTSEDAMKKVVWSETVVDGGRHFNGKLKMPPSTTGPYQNQTYVDAMAAMVDTAHKTAKPYYKDTIVLAIPYEDITRLPQPKILANGVLSNGATLIDGDPTSGIKVPMSTKEKPSTIQMSYAHDVTIRSATLFVPGAKTLVSSSVLIPALEASDDENSWHKIAEIPLTEVATTIAFAPVTARYFRVVLMPAPEGSLLAQPADGADMTPAAGLLTPLETLNISEFRLSPDTRVDQFQSKAGFAIAPDYYKLSQDIPDDSGVQPNAIINLTSHMRADGTLNWTPPQGQWTVLRFGASLLGTTNHPATNEATGLEVDKYDASAVRRYLDHYIKSYVETVGEGSLKSHGVKAMVNDSIEVGPSNWTPRMVERFRELRGYDPTPWMPTLAGYIIGSRSESDRFLYDYRRTIADLMSSEHYATIAEVARTAGLTTYGEALEQGRPSLGDDMAMRSHAAIPMAAMWAFSSESGPKPALVADIRGAASVSHIYGRNIVAAESMTSMLSPWSSTPHDLRRVVDLEFALGVNRPVVHTSVHQPVDDKVPGLSLSVFGQYFNRHETWAEMARPWVDYLARTSWMLQQGHNVADVAYYYGEEAPLVALYGEKQVSDAPVDRAFDFINTDALMSQLSVRSGRLVSPGGADYAVLYLGGTSSRMTLPTLQRIYNLTRAGATVIGSPPVGSPSLKDDADTYAALVKQLWSGQPETIVGAGKVIRNAGIGTALDRIGVLPDFAYDKPGAEIMFVHRVFADTDIYFVSNRNNRPEKIEGRFRVTGKEPEIWRADTGMTSPTSYSVDNEMTKVTLDLGAEESYFVVFRKPTTTLSHNVPTMKERPSIPLSGPWKVSFEQDRGAPASITMTALTPLNESSEVGIRYFSGVTTYSTMLQLPTSYRPGRRTMLDLGAVGDVAEVRINGRVIGTVWHAPWQIDIGNAAAAGANEIEVRVANSWVNRLIGDAQPGAKKITWTALPTYTSKAPLRPSGLIGPVYLRPAD